MRHLWLALIAPYLAGCLYLPVTGGETAGVQDEHAETMSVLIGKSESEVSDDLPGLVDSVLYENGRKHLLYRQTKDFGFLIFGIGGGYSGHIYAGIVGDRDRCFRLTFDAERKLENYDTKILYINLFSGIDRSDIDCRNAFWSLESLKTIREQHEQCASRGHRESILIMARSYGELQPLKKLATEGDVDAALVLAREFDDTGPLSELARKEDDAPQLLLLLAREFGKTEPLVEWTVREKDVDLAFILASEYGINAPLEGLAEENKVTATKLNKARENWLESSGLN